MIEIKGLKTSHFDCRHWGWAQESMRAAG